MSDLVHLDTVPRGSGAYEDHHMHCGEEFAREYTNDVTAVTCVACLDSAQADAEEMAAQCAVRREALREAARPSNPPSPPLPPIQIVADENVPPDRAYVIGSPLKVAPGGRIERGVSAAVVLFQREAAAYAEQCAADEALLADAEERRPVLRREDVQAVSAAGFAEWHVKMLGTVTTYERAFGPLAACVHPRHGGGWTYSASLHGHHVDIDPDAPDPRFDTVAEAGRCADTWLVDTMMAIASAAYDARLIP